MVLGTHSIPIWKSEGADGETPRLFLGDALQEFSRSRATRRLIREGLARDIRSALQVPLAYEVYVRPGDRQGCDESHARRFGRPSANALSSISALGRIRYCLSLPPERRS